ncbi:histidine kinase [Sphingomonas sp. Leaf412]|uniref:sensor histidine kinase n=1 Tax=Sphingomonas sp. Leaf412 TaxID=1736370 RepID=UPI0006F46A97|nr:ATP-binding protein [Sphingomonas sp. Leaf412]KQT34728.1 histidine kinase [Sphingomonas sp. Leaf412]
MRAPRLPGWTWWIAATLVVAALAAAVAATVAGRYARAAVAAQTATDAQLRAAFLDSEVARFRLLPLALSADRDVLATLDGRPGARAVLDRKLGALARTTGAAVIYLVGPAGRAVAASNFAGPQSFVGRDYRFRRYYRVARARGEASQFALGTVSGRPGLYLARRTDGGGVVVVKLEFDRIERAWRRAGGTTYVRDAAGMVVVASRPDWRFATTRPLSPATVARLRTDASLRPGALRPLPAPARNEVERSIAAAQDGWTLTLRGDAARATAAAARGWGIGAALAVIAVAALAWGLRQRALLTRRRTAQLEEAVAARTADLTREIEERTASEARAATLREGLRQANRLATLGQITASVAHETAQPVAAIRTYADNGLALLDRGDHATVRANLDAIRRLADRIGTVTAELRGFSRRRAGELRAVPLDEVIDGALLILKEQLRGLTLDRPAPDPARTVLCGRVRLEQVVVNLLQNAIEALRDTADPRIAITVARDGAMVAVVIADNGPGIAADIAPRLFTPFATSRQDGLGLGLAIAHDIMVDMGGALRLADGGAGATFVLTVRAA